MFNYLNYCAAKIYYKFKNEGFLQLSIWGFDRVLFLTFKNIFLFFNFICNFLINIKSASLVLFKNEGEIKLIIPKISVFDLFSSQARSNVTKLAQLRVRPGHEVLLRSIIYNLYKTSLLDSQKSIIDIGSWIGDNALVWAGLLDAKSNALVYAIDPSQENIDFGKLVANLNTIRNIQWHAQVCSNIPNQKLALLGNINHASFAQSGVGMQYLLSTTIDDIIPEYELSNIGLFHIDVEGLEYQVMEGAAKVIQQSNPIILFEQHISTENVEKVIDFLGGYKYSVYMINEVLPGCNLDCRNFLATPSSVDLDLFISKFNSKELAHGSFPATVGNCLLKIYDKDVGYDLHG